jgi:hypothetical protein
VKAVACIVAVLFVMVFIPGCTTQYENPAITVTALDTGDLLQEPIPPLDMYTADFLIKNNGTFTDTNVKVQVDMSPEGSFCHHQQQTITLPSLGPGQSSVRSITFYELGGLDCRYLPDYQVFSDPPP